MSEQVVENKKKLPLAAIIGALVLAVVILVVVLITTLGSDSRKIKSGLSDGNKYLAELDYDAAILAFEKVLSLDPKNVDAYLGIIGAYIGKGDYEKAYEYATAGYNETGNADILAKKEALEAIVNGDAPAPSSGSDDKAVTDKKDKPDKKDDGEDFSSGKEGEVLTLDLSEYDRFYNSRGGVIIVSQGENLGAIDYDGNVLVPCQYSGNFWQSPTSKGYFALSDSVGNRYIFDNKGNIVISDADIKALHNDFYIVAPPVFEDSEAFYYTYDGDMVLRTRREWQEGWDYFGPLYAGTYLGEELVYDQIPLDGYDYDAYNTAKAEEERKALDYLTPDSVLTVSSEYAVEEKLGILRKDGSVEWLWYNETPLWWIRSIVSGHNGSNSWPQGNVFNPISPIVDGYYTAVDPTYDSEVVVLMRADGTFMNRIEGVWSTVAYNGKLYMNSEVYDAETGYVTGFGAAYLDCNYIYNVGTKMVLVLDEGASYALVDAATKDVLAIYDSITINPNGHCLISTEESWGYCNLNGDIEVLYQDAGSFINGVAPIIEDGIGYVIDESFNKVATIGEANSTHTTGDLLVFETADGTKLYVTR